jgi:hypothetical protein
MHALYLRCLILSAGAVLTVLSAFIPARAVAAECLTRLTVNLTVELSPQLGKPGEDLVIELRQGVPGNSRVATFQKFRGRTGTAFFYNLCAGPYFMAIGNGPKVAVTPVREFNGTANFRSTIRLTFGSGNVDTRSRSGL